MKNEINLWNKSSVDFLQDVVHLQEFRLNEWAVRATDVTDVVQAQIVENQNVPVIPLKCAVQVTGYIVVNLVKKKSTRCI